MNPYWNALIVGGWEEDQPYVFLFSNGKGWRMKSTVRMLGYVDLLGTTYTSPTIATGFGAYLAQPLLRKATENRDTPPSQAEARAVLEDCLKVLFYRDARSVNKVRSTHHSPLSTS